MTTTKKERQAIIENTIEALKTECLRKVYTLSEEEMFAGVTPDVMGHCEVTTDYIAGKLRDLGYNAICMCVDYDDMAREYVKLTPTHHWMVLLNGKIYDPHNEILNDFGIPATVKQQYNNVTEVRLPEAVI